jgi:hypothetical protein
VLSIVATLLAAVAGWLWLPSPRLPGDRLKTTRSMPPDNRGRRHRSPRGPRAFERASLTGHSETSPPQPSTTVGVPPATARSERSTVSHVLFPAPARGPMGGSMGTPVRPLTLTKTSPSAEPTTPSASLGPARTFAPAVAARAIMSALVAAVAGVLVVGGAVGWVVGTGLFAVTLFGWRRREPPALRRERARVMADLPFAAELMVACLRAGRPVSAAVEAAAGAVGGPLGERLAQVSGHLRLGAEAEEAWSPLAADVALAPLVRAMVRAAASGAPVAETLTRLADDSRAAARVAAVTAARRVGVQVVAPLGLCFLPAFVLLGIVPVIAGLAADVLLP